MSLNSQILFQISQSNPNPRSVGPYTHRHRILTLGDGNLSFSLSLSTVLGGSKLVATTFDSHGEVLQKYPEAEPCINTLRGMGARVFHAIDATRLAQDENPALAGPFDRIVFNFPHVGGSTSEDVKQNQELLTEFFKGAATRLEKGQPDGSFLPGEIHVALRKTPFYDSWKIRDLAGEAGLVLVKESPFEAAKFIGYEARRTSPAVREAPSTEGARLYAFKLRQGGPGEKKKNDKLKKKQKKKKKAAKAAAARAAEAEGEDEEVGQEDEDEDEDESEVVPRPKGSAAEHIPSRARPVPKGQAGKPRGPPRAESKQESDNRRAPKVTSSAAGPKGKNKGPRGNPDDLKPKKHGNPTATQGNPKGKHGELRGPRPHPQHSTGVTKAKQFNKKR